MDYLYVFIASLGLISGSLAQEYFTKKDYKEGLVVGCISAIIFFVSFSLIIYFFKLYGGN